jgi:hypothetical protein
MTKARSLAERFWRRVDKGSPEMCWLWRGQRRRGGYGGIEDGQGRKLSAHRVAWILTRGNIPDGLFVCHSCDEPRCVNPAHLFLGTADDNMADMVAKGRQVSGSAKLIPAEATAIRELATAGKHTHRELAKMFGVTRPTVSNILARRTWRTTP